MSLILDALKKLEQEKSNRKGKSRELAPAILQERREKASFRWRPVLLIGIAVTCTAAVTVLVMRQLASSDAKPSMAVTASRLDPGPLIKDIRSARGDAQPPSVSPPAPEQQAATAISRGKPMPVASPYPAPSESEPPVSSAPELKVSGIAWQEEQEARRAVVNGALVREGGVVAGARVKEILPDRVRFSVGGRLLDISNTTPFH